MTYKSGCRPCDTVYNDDTQRTHCDWCDQPVEQIPPGVAAMAWLNTSLHNEERDLDWTGNLTPAEMQHIRATKLAGLPEPIYTPEAFPGLG